MEHKTFKFEYSIVQYKDFEIDIEQLADLLIRDFVKDDKDLVVEDLIDSFDDNMNYYLRELGFPEDSELDDYNYDYIYDGIYDDLEAILYEKVNKA